MKIKTQSLKLWTCSLTLFAVLSWSEFIFATNIKTHNESWPATISQTSDANSQWKTHRDESADFSFDLIYNAKHQELAELYIQKIKQSYKFFKPFIKTYPDRVVIVLRDQTDLTNGYATPIPYPHMVLYPVLPNSVDSLSETSDWPLELFSHEMTHILTFEPTRGVLSVMKSIFGTIVAPNILLPTWWKEGVAVEIETQVSSGGRLRSKYQEAYLRTVSLADRWNEKTIDRVNEELPEWPRGQHPYIFGSLFFSYVVKEKGLNVVNSFFQLQSGRVPYFIEAPAYELLDSSYENYYNLILYKTSDLTLRQLKSINQSSRLQDQPTEQILNSNDKGFEFINLDFKNKNTNAYFPQFSAEGKKIAFLSLNKKDETVLQVFNSNSLQSKALGQTTGLIDRFQFSKDGNHIFLSKVDSTSNKTSFSDLYLWDYTNKKIYPMSFELRCREIQISEDNASYTCVRVADGRTQLLLGKIDISQLTMQNTGFFSLRNKSYPPPLVLFESQIQEKISFPVFLNSNEILYSYRNLKGEEYIEKINVLSQQREIFFKDNSQTKHPLVFKNNIYFLSDRNGTFNIYNFDQLTKKISPLTNTPSTILTFTFSPQDQSLWSTLLTDDGYSITQINYDQWSTQNQKLKLPQITPLLEPHYVKPIVTDATDLALEKINADLTTDYSPGSYLIPRYWLPFVSASQTGYLIEAQTSAHDPLSFHLYNLSANYDSYLQRGGYYFLYSYQKYAWSWILNADRTNRVFGSRDLISSTESFSLSTSPDLTLFSKKTILNLGLNYEKEEISNTSEFRVGPFFQVGYVNYIQPRTEVSPLEGYGFSFIGENYIQKESYQDYSLATLTGLYFFSKYLPKGHALAAKINGFHIFNKISHLNGTSSQSTFLSYDSISPTFVLRGYKNGKFFGRSLVSTNLEYRFPILNIYRGSGTDPYFLKRFFGALTFDTLSTDGFGLNKEETAYKRITTTKRFYSYGVEAHLESTIGYVLPLTFVLGYYVGQDKVYNPNGEFNLSLLIGTSQ